MRIPSRPNRYFALTAMVFLFVLAGPLPAQQQPVVAENQQNEVVNFNRPVNAGRDEFTIFRSGDMAEINHYVSEVVELKKAVALEILQNVLRAVQLEKGTAKALKHTDPDTDEEQYYLQIITTEEQMPSILKTIQALDLPRITSSSGDIKYHRRIKYLFSVERDTLVHSKLYVIVTPTFKNQVLFKASSLNSSTFDATPPVEVNTSIAPLSPSETQPLAPEAEPDSSSAPTPQSTPKEK